MAAIDAEFLRILACPDPECRRPLVLRGEQLECTGCGVCYRIEEGRPVLIPEEAEPPEEKPESPKR